MRAGTLDRRITIEQRSLSQDAYGQDTATWSEWATVWAQKRPKTGREYFEAHQERAEAEVVWRIRHRDGVKAGEMRVNDGDHTYDIESVIEMGRREGLELLTKAEVE
jgi:SPP1 family predicted phage head-tail adaptor